MEFARMGVEVVNDGAPAGLYKLVVELVLLAWINAAQLENRECILELAKELCQ